MYNKKVEIIKTHEKKKRLTLKAKKTLWVL